MVFASDWLSLGVAVDKMSQLRKHIVLTPEQLDKLRGRDRDLSDRYDIDRRHVLGAVAEKAKRIGPTQAYVQYRAAQQRHLQHAAKERTEPLEMVLSDARSASPTFEEKLAKVEEQSLARLQRDRGARQQEAAREAEQERRRREEEARLEEANRKRELEEALARRAAKRAQAEERRRAKQEQSVRRSSRTAEKNRETWRQSVAFKHKKKPDQVGVVNPTFNQGAQHLLSHRSEAKWLKLNR